MNKIVLAVFLAAVIAAVSAGGYGHYSLGYGFTAAGYGHGHGGYGHHHGGVAKVNVHQTPYGYQYNLNEHGPGYTKYIHQGASTHHAYPVHGYGGGYGYGR